VKQTAQRALSRSGRYVHLFEHELEVLDTLPAWTDRLFRVLVQRSSYDTGQGRTTYAELRKALSPLQPARGGPRHPVPSEKAILRALVKLSDARIVWRNTGWSQQAGALFFELAPRRLKARPQSSSVTESRHPPDALKNEQRRGF